MLVFTRSLVNLISKKGTALCREKLVLLRELIYSAVDLFTMGFIVFYQERCRDFFQAGHGSLRLDIKLRDYRANFRREFFDKIGIRFFPR